MAPDGLLPPGQYGWVWAALAFGLILAVVLAGVLVAVLTRPRRPPRPDDDTPPRSAEVLAQLRQEYFGEIQRIEDAYRAGRIDARHANRELSRLVRAYVNEYSGLEAPVLALDDLVAHGVHPALVDALRRHYYPSLFRRGPAVDPLAGAAAAREVVTAWH